MTAVADFGPLITEVDIDLAVIRTIRLWLPTYLAQLERERDLGENRLARPAPGSYANTLEDDEFFDHALPAVIVTTAATSDQPETDGTGRYYATWRCTVSTVVRGSTPPETRALAALFGGSVRRVLVQQPDLGGFAGGTRWIDGGIAAVPDTTDNGRYLAASVNTFNVVVDDVLSSGGGPQLPDPVYEDPDPEQTPGQTYGTPVPVGSVTTDVLKRS